MVAFSIFIVTYKNDDLLHRCLHSIKQAISTLSLKDSITVTIMNNYGVLVLPKEFEFAHIINNQARPDFSTGHLSRSWNQCILHGIRDIDSPACDVLILAQNDVVFKPNFLKIVKNLTKAYDYITLGRGDEVQIVTPQSIKKTGLFDERFCNIGFQEADYFLRAVLTNPTRVSINDRFHNRLHNPISNVGSIIEDVPSGYMRGDESHLASSRYHRLSLGMFVEKWQGILPYMDLETIYNGPERYPIEDWDDLVKQSKAVPRQYIMYPYFECALPDLNLKYLNT